MPVVWLAHSTDVVDEFFMAFFFCHMRQNDRMAYLVPASGARLLYGAHREKYDCYGQQEIPGIFKKINQVFSAFWRASYMCSGAP